MRLRNIPRAESVLANTPDVMQDPTLYKGSWQKEIFQNDHPVAIEVGMGKGQFLLTLASQRPDINYVGIEQYSSVLLRAVERLDAQRKDRAVVFPNLRLTRLNARTLPDVFAPGEVEKIYINFPDPWPKARYAKRRLTSKDYLTRYDQVLIPGGEIEVKTDQKDLFDFSKEQVMATSSFTVTAATSDLHHDPVLSAGNIQTEYEEKFSAQHQPIYKLVIRKM